MEHIYHYSNHFPPLVWNLIVMASSLVLGLIVRSVFHSFLNFNYKRSDYYLFKSLRDRLSKILSFFLPLIVFNIFLPLLRLTSTAYTFLDKVVEIAFTICFAILLMGIVRIAEDYVYHKYDYGKTDNLKERKVRTQLQFIRKVMVLMIAVVTVSLVLLSFENFRKIGSGLLTSVGVGGIIIGFAAQRSLANLLAGFQIAFTQPMRIDDVLVVEGQFGKVEEITLTYVVLSIWDKRRLILPINYFIEKPFENWTRTSSDLLAAVYLYMDYSIPVDPLKQELSRLLNSSPLWDNEVNSLAVTDAKENTVEVRALMSARNSGDAFDLKCFIRENLIKFIQANYPDCLPKVRNTLAEPGSQPPFLSA